MGCFSSAADAPTEAQVFHAKYITGAKLGMGAFAQVHLCRRIKSSAVFAAKVQSLFKPEDMPTCQDTGMCKSVMKEMMLWARIGQHKNCVQLHECFVDNFFCYMVMERCERPLMKHLELMPLITEKSLSLMFCQMLEGISHIHALNIMHRDIKPQNFLVDGCTIKLADFGLSRSVLPGCKVQGVAGTVPFMSPEMLKIGEADLKADVWSFGVTAHMLLNGEFPYNPRDFTCKAMKRAIREGSPPTCNRPWLSGRAVVFLQALLERDAGLRVSADRASHTEYIRTCEDPEGKDPIDLRPMLQAGSEAGIFASVAGSHLDHIDEILMDVNRSGKHEINPDNILNQTMVNDIIRRSSAAGIDLMDKHIRNSKAQEDNMSNNSTACSSSLNRDPIITPSSSSSYT